MSVRKHDNTNAAPGCGSCCLRARGLGVRLGGTEILREVSLHLHCGEIAALIGPNGAGKTTLFGAILGQVEHSGTIAFTSADGTPMRPVVGYVPQSPTFDRGEVLSVLDLYIAAAGRRPVFLPVPKSLRAAALACLERVHGGELLDRQIGRLSGGELQRVLLALALEPLPHLLLLDEPFSGVDVEGEQQIWDMLIDIARRFDLSILLSTHDFASLPQFADQVILLNQTVLKTGAPAEVLGSAAFRQAFHLGGAV